VLASGQGSNLQAILDASARRDLDAQVVVVVADRPGARALERARASGVPEVSFPPHPGESRRGYDERLGELVAAHAPDIVVLAGWSRLLSTTFLDRFASRVVNLHPALPGELPGLHAIERAHAEALAGARTRTGVMVHLVPDEGVDDGPVLGSVEVAILPGEPLHELAARMHAAEHRLLVDVLARLCRSSTALDDPTSAIDVARTHRPQHRAQEPTG
jgi:phosphoribosylglycinamide formyltransferase-1